MISAFTATALGLHVQRRLEDGAGLHLGDLGVGDAQPAAAVAQHGVELVQVLHAHADLAPGDTPICCAITAGRPRRAARIRAAAGRAGGSSPAARPWRGTGLRSRCAASAAAWPAPCAAGLVVGQDHLAHGVDAFALEEHVLGAAQADAGGAEAPGHLALLRACRRWRAPPAACAVGQRHQLAEVAAELGVLAWRCGRRRPRRWSRSARSTRPRRRSMPPMVIVRALGSTCTAPAPTRSTCPCRAPPPRHGWSCRRAR
jgi:hypothetical protein